MAFAKASSQRLFSASVDKTFKVHDIPSGFCIKTIVAPAAITLMSVDSVESNVYLACDNQNIYHFFVESSG